MRRIMNLSASKKWLAEHPQASVVLIIVFCAICYGLWSWLFASDEDEIIYTEEVVVRGDIENLVTATGILQPREYVDVGAQVSGQLKKLHVEVGSEVKAGDLLAEIDATVYAAKVDATRAQLRNQKAQLLDKEAQLQLAEINFKRQQNLQKEDATTEESLQTTEASLKSAHNSMPCKHKSNKLNRHYVLRQPILITHVFILLWMEL
jgi:membrane fusion protein, macrolide-specific efflux system